MEAKHSFTLWANPPRMPGCRSLVRSGLVGLPCLSPAASLGLDFGDVSLTGKSFAELKRDGECWAGSSSWNTEVFVA